MVAPDGLHINQLLTNVSIAYRNGNYIADRIFPVVSVQNRADIVPKYDRSHWFRDDAKPRLSGTKSGRGNFTVNVDDTYYCNRYSWAEEVADDDRANTDAPFNLDVDASELATDKILLKREIAFATDHFTTGKWANDETGGTDFAQWSNYATSDPLVDFTTYMDDVEGRIGLEANAVAMGKQVWNKLRWHPTVVDSIKFTQTGVVSEQIFQSLVGISELLIGRALYTTDPEGTSESNVTLQRIWGKNVLFFYKNSRVSLRQPQAGMTFVWANAPATGGSIQAIKQLRDDEREVDIFEANTYFDQKITSALAGTFLSGAVS